ncbi:MAG: AAA family ATPase [Bauldia sp.]
MALEGPAGAERLAEIVGDFFVQITAIAEARGGELTTLAGDAVVFVWFVDDDANPSDAILSATDAGLAIQDMTAARRGPTDLAVRCSIAAGPLHHLEIGGRADEWHAVLSGSTMRDATSCSALTRPGEVALAPTAWHTVRDRCRSVSERPGIVIVDQVAEPPRPARAAATNDPDIPPSILRAAIPPIVLERLESGRLWQGEFRTVTAVFTALRQPEHARPEDALASVQTATTLVQAVLARFEGHLHQIRTDEHGITLIAVFGLPPFAHEDDATRATQAALALDEEWTRMGVATSTGIATGRVFATTLGRTGLFTLVGPAMNLAARLMQLNTGVVCDGDTVRAGRQHRRIAARELAPRFLKGKAEAIVAFAPYTIAAAPTTLPAKAPLFVGRTAETAAIDLALRQLLQGRGGTIVIEGEAGIGKTALLDRARAAAGGSGITILVGYADDTERRSPYYAWRPVFQALFGTLGIPAAERAAAVAGALGDRGHLVPLLAEILEVPLADSPETLQLVGEARAASTRNLLLERLAEAARSSPCAIVVEDIHWLDTSSWALLVETAEAGLPVLLICATRPNPSEEAAYQHLLSAPQARHFKLEGFSAAETSAALASAFGAATVAAEVSDVVLARTGGNPLFIGEIVPLMRDRGLLLVERGKVEVASSAGLAKEGLDRALSARGVSSTLEGIVLARFDRLPPRRKATLQAAAIIGQTFSLAELRDLVADGGSIEDDLSALAAEDFLAPRRDLPTADFRHAVIRDVVYGALSFAERRGLHHRLAEALATTEAALAGAIDVRLGHHFGTAGDDEKAIPYLLRAAQDALKIFANVEAIALASDALDRIRGVSSGVTADAGRGWVDKEGEAEVALAKANHALSRYSDARRHAEATLALTSRIPSSQISLIREIGRLAAIQLKRRIRPLRRKRETSFRNLRATFALEYLFEIYFFAGDDLRTVYAALRMVDEAERAQDPGRAAHGYANLAGVAGAIPMRRVARYYRMRALANLDRTDDLHVRTWVSTVAALTHMSVGEWEQTLALLGAALDAAYNTNDQRSWRAVIEFRSIVAALRGDWGAAVADAEAMLESANRHRDRRAQVSIWRDLGHYAIHLSEWDGLRKWHSAIEGAIADGLTADETATRLDSLAFAAALAIQDGDFAAGRRLALASVALMKSERLSFPNYFWTIRLVFAALGPPGSSADASMRSARRTVRAELKRQARSHAIAEPTSLLCRGIEVFARGERAKASRNWTEADSLARDYGMAYDSALAQGLNSRPGPQLLGDGLFTLLRQSWSTAGSLRT